MSLIQSRAAALEWDAMRDHERYYPLRDGPRLYAAVWVIDTMRRFLPPDQVDLARTLHATQRALEARGGQNAYERVDCSPRHAEAFQRQQSANIRLLAGYEAASLYRVGGDGRRCFLGVIEGDSQAELARRVRYPESSKRSLRRLVQITMEALSEYRDECEADMNANNLAR